ncbi:hypothetical protein K9K83_02035, partial [Candidatus Woesearchaeota archaeon]|nr:hypothetical protein [Candidatus Woesearchaeota archaeon]
MSELLFGQFANMNSFELEVAQKLAIDANIYQPVFGDNGVINIFMRETEKKEESKKIILPLDILKIKSEQLFSKEAIEELKNKFISTPDYILLEKENEKIKLIPIDAKGGKIPFIPKKTPKNLKKQLTLEPKHNNQISAYNLAYLIQQSTYLQVAIERAKQDLKSEDVEIHNGYYYMKKENTEKQTKEKLNIQELEIQNGIYKIKKDSQQKLEEKIKEELKQKNITGSLDLTSNNQTLKLMNPKISEKKNTLFITNKEYLITELNWPTFLEELGFIKNKIKYRGFYGTPVVAIGANSQGEIIKQLEYNPNTRIKTYSPRQKKLNEILKEIDEQVKDQTEILKKIPSQIEEIIHTTTPELAQEIYEAALNKVSDNLYKLEIEQLNERKERIIQSLILTEKDLINIEKKKKNSVNELEKNELINEYNKKKQEYIEKIKNRNELLEKIQTRKTEITKDHESGMLEISNFSKESEIESEINNILQNLSEMNYKSNTKLKPKVIKLKKL